ncbi:hypothetical protein ACFSCZ_12785 [Siminovitchia sediminis]|uniref:Uncharacterized protein n=1 Tax=Siminovitchia sediminis TaxID=1274353 RepID=A0ABW4KHS4_9BACI
MSKKSDEEFFRKLDEYQVEVPEFSIQKSRWERMANWLFDTAPLPDISMNETGMRLTLTFPVLLSVLSVMPLIFL